MKKLMIVLALAAAVAVQAETIKGKVYVEKEKYWHLSKDTKDGKVVDIANINKADAGKIAPFDGKFVEVTGNLNPESRFPSFLPGIEIKEATPDSATE